MQICKKWHRSAGLTLLLAALGSLTLEAQSLSERPFPFHPAAIRTPAEPLKCPAPPRALSEVKIAEPSPQIERNKFSDFWEGFRRMERAGSRHPFEDYLKRLSLITDVYQRTGEPTYAECAAYWLEAWALGQAMLGEVANPASHWQRQWMLSGLALNYLKIAPAPELGEPSRQRIEAWLRALGQAVRGVWEQSPAPHDQNYSWAGLAVMAAGVATQHPELRAWGRQVYRETLAQVTPEGLLPLELERGARALHLHHLALQALIMLAELAEAQGEPLYPQEAPALQRLIEASMQGMSEAQLFNRRAPAKQNPPSEDVLIWLEPYLRRFPRAEWEPVLQRNRPFFLARLGGDLTWLFSAPATPAKP